MSGLWTGRRGVYDGGVSSEVYRSCFLSTLPDGDGTVGTSTATRFNVDSDDTWDKDFSYPGPSTIWQACAPANLHGFHENLWTSQHDLTVTWSYPAACASGSSSGRQSISVGYL